MTVVFHCALYILRNSLIFFWAVLEVPQEKVQEVLAAILSGLQAEDFTVTEIPIEEGIALTITLGTFCPRKRKNWYPV